MKRLLASLFMLIWIPVVPVLCQDDHEPLVTDRPDFTESSETIPVGGIQFEFGYTYSRTGADKSHALGELLVRAALHRIVELRVGLNSHTWNRGPAGDTSGIEDSSLGVKVKILEGRENPGFGKPHIALLLLSTVSTGHDEIGADKPQPEAKLAFAWDLTERLALSSNVGYAYLTGEDGHYGECSGSLALGFALSDSVGAYIEYYGFLNREDEIPDLGYVNGGFTWLLTNNLQLDFRVGGSHNGPSPDYFAGVGAAWRWFYR